MKIVGDISLPVFLFVYRVYTLGLESAQRLEELTNALKQFGPVSLHIILGGSDVE